MTRETEQAIWSRVRGPGAMNAETALLPERLEQLILDQKRNAAQLRQLSRRLSGPGRAQLARMAGESDDRARELTAVHYLLTGRRLRLQPKPEPLPRDLPEALRTASLRQQEAARSFAALAGDFSDWSETFSRMGRDSRSMLERITRLLRAQMR